MVAHCNPTSHLQEFRCLSSFKFSVCLYKSHLPFQSWMYGCWDSLNANREPTRSWFHRVTTPKHRCTDLLGPHNSSTVSWWTKWELKSQECSISTFGLGFQLTVRKRPGSGRAAVPDTPEYPWFLKFSGNSSPSLTLVLTLWKHVEERVMHGIWQTRIANLSLSC